MLFKMVAIQRIWQQYPKMGPKPRQVFVTQSRVLASKVEGYFSKLMSSFEAAASPEPHVIGKEVEEVEHVDDTMDQDDLTDKGGNQQQGSGLKERFSELRDKDFPLFITYDQVRVSFASKHLISLSREQLCAMLENDIRRDDQGDGLITPKTHVLGDEVTSSTSATSPWKSRLRTESGMMSSSDYMQQFRRHFVSYGAFLASYWDHLPQTFTQVLGEN